MANKKQTKKRTAADRERMKTKVLLEIGRRIAYGETRAVDAARYKLEQAVVKAADKWSKWPLGAEEMKLHHAITALRAHHQESA